MLSAFCQRFASHRSDTAAESSLWPCKPSKTALSGWGRTYYTEQSRTDHLTLVLCASLGAGSRRLGHSLRASDCRHSYQSLTLFENPAWIFTADCGQDRQQQEVIGLAGVTSAIDRVPSPALSPRWPETAALRYADWSCSYLSHSVGMRGAKQNLPRRDGFFKGVPQAAISLGRQSHPFHSLRPSGWRRGSPGSRSRPRWRGLHGDAPDSR